MLEEHFLNSFEKGCVPDMSISKCCVALYVFLRIATWKNQFRMRELDDKGALQNCARLIDAGFKLGDSAESFLKGDWKVADAKAAPEMLDDFMAKSAPVTQARCSTPSLLAMTKSIWFSTWNFTHKGLYKGFFHDLVFVFVSLWLSLFALFGFPFRNRSFTFFGFHFIFVLMIYSLLSFVSFLVCVRFFCKSAWWAGCRDD